MSTGLSVDDAMEVDGSDSGWQGIRKEGFLGPVTSLFWDPLGHVLFAGRGCDLLIYDIDRVCLGSLRPFQDGRVHVVKSRSLSTTETTAKLLVAASSEKQVTLSEVHLTNEPRKGLQSTTTVGRLPLLADWVLDLQMLRTPGGSTAAETWEMIAVGLAHNNVEIWNWATSVKMRAIRCEENPLLCSLAFFGDEEQQLKVACGGFTREVLCWQVGSSPSRIVHRLRGHTGVIHCVKWRADGRLLISASEDRCVRVWEAVEGAAESVLPPMQQTHVLWGHAARIWDCRVWRDIVVSSSEDGTGRMYRLGSKGQGSGASEGAVESLGVLKGHQGKHVWRCEVCAVGDEWKAATGGNDAAVKLWTSGEGGEGEGRGGSSGEHKFQVASYAAPTEWPAEEDVEEAGAEAEGAKEREEFVRCCRMVEEGRRVVCGTNQGRCVVLEAGSGAWRCVLRDSRCQFTAVDVDEERGVVVLGDARGGLSVASLDGRFQRGRGGRVGAHDGHVMDVFARSDAGTERPVWYTGDNAETAEGGAVRRWAVEEGEGRLQELGVIRCGTRCRVTCVMECQWEGRVVVVCGDRKGTLSVVELPGRGGAEGGGGGAGELSPSSQVAKAHKANSVTSVSMHTDGRVYSTGRDGAVCVWRLGRGAGGRVELVKEASVKGWGGLEMISGVAWDRAGRMQVTGFQHMHFVLADVAERRLLASIDCGGARRPYGFLFRDAARRAGRERGRAGAGSQSGVADPRGLCLAFVRDLKLHLATCADAPPAVALPGADSTSPAASPSSSAPGSPRDSPRGGREGGGVWFHGREVHQVMVRAVGGARGPVEALTVSEDGSSKAVRLRKGAGEGGGWEMECVGSLEGDRHVQLGAALRSMVAVRMEGGGEVLVAGGAKDVVHCWGDAAAQGEGGMAVEGGDGAGQGWRLLSTVRVPTGKGVMARLLGMAAVDGRRLRDARGEVAAVVAGADDGLGRVLGFHVALREWRLGCMLAFHRVAILAVSGFAFGERRLVVTGAADGKVAVWDPTSALDSMRGLFDDAEAGAGARGGEKRLEASLAARQSTTVAPRQTWFRHGSGVNAVEVAPSGRDGEYWMVTAGDDQQIRVMAMRVAGGGDGADVQVEGGEELGVVERAHSSTIRGIALVGSRAVVSVGADQRVNVWALPELKLLCSCVTEVCDASCVDVGLSPAEAASGAQEVLAVVGGMGVQTLSFSLP